MYTKIIFNYFTNSATNAMTDGMEILKLKLNYYYNTWYEWIIYIYNILFIASTVL